MRRPIVQHVKLNTILKTIIYIIASELPLVNISTNGIPKNPSQEEWAVVQSVETAVLLKNFGLAFAVSVLAIGMFAP